MSKKGKGKKSAGGTPGKKGGGGDDDWDDEIEAMLLAEASKKKSILTETSSPPLSNGISTASTTASTNEKSSEPVNVDEDEDGDVDGDGGGEDTEVTNAAGTKDKKKKKKKAKKDDSSTTTSNASVAAATPPLSAAGKAILLRKQQLAEDEAKRKALQEAEDRRVREIEEKKEAERQAILQEKERKKKAKHDKIAAQKAAGTYMTKAEKEKARKIQERLQSLKASGVELPTMEESTKIVYSRKKKLDEQKNELKKSQDQEVEDEDSDDSDEEEDINRQFDSSEKVIAVHMNGNGQMNSSTSIITATTSTSTLTTESQSKGEISERGVGNDDNDGKEEGGEEDWEQNIDAIISKVADLKVTAPVPINRSNNEEDEDLLEMEKKAEKERIKQLGIERLKREEEIKMKRELEERERAELDRQAREIAQRKEISKRKRLEREAMAKAARTPDNLRAAISVIMGHVDTGKTKLLDKIRNTNVQEGEAGGITQQIGATHFPRETLTLQTNVMQAKSPFEIKLPGLLVIDTPGHESFTNLRNRGSSLCDVAILVIDLMHGLEPQTIESINLLRRKNAPFIVALNKVDRLYGWKKLPDGSIRDALAQQDENCIAEFKDRSDNIILQLNKLGLNAKMYWENDSLEDTISLVPTSAMSGEGVPDLLMNLIQYAQNQLQEKLMYFNYLQCTVLEVKVIEGLGPSIDVVLLNGVIREGDRIVVSTLEGPLVTTIRALLTPPPNREMRIKSEYIHHQSVQGAMGVKVVAPDLTRAVAGTPLMVIHEDDDEEELMEDVQSDLSSVTKLSTDSKGVIVHASTLGALEALLQFLQKECKPSIPVSAVSIGTIFKKDVMKAAIMNDKGLPEYATILAFDVRIDPEAQTYAEEVNVRIFTADIIYHLFDQFSSYMNALIETRKTEAQGRAVFPCVLKIFPQHVFNKKDPIVVGVEVIEGTLKVQTPLCIPQLGLDVGRVVSIENNHKEATQAKKGTSVSIKITCESNPNLMYGRQFDHTNALYSKISRDSIDALKDFFKDDVSKEDWLLILKLKKIFNITDQSKKKTASATATLRNKEKEKERESDMPLMTDYEYED